VSHYGARKPVDNGPLFQRSPAPESRSGSTHEVPGDRGIGTDAARGLDHLRTFGSVPPLVRSVADHESDRANRYPHHPGAKTGGTSAESADAIAGRAQRLRDTVMAVLELHGPSTADQVASLLSQSVLSIRPRVAELHKMGLIVATGERRRNRSGHSAMTWRIA
jgi:hypothetical protein